MAVLRVKPHRLDAGTVIGEAYRVESLIGKGSMGAVYAATELARGERCALKVMSPKLFDDAKANYRFEREARLGKSIPSQGVTHTLDSIVWFDVPVWLVTHRELRTSRRIRVVFDILARELRRLTAAEDRSPAGP